MIQLGDKFEVQITFNQEMVNIFASITGDDNPLHLDPEYCAGTRFKRPIVHGAFCASLFSRVIGKDFPGPGTVYLEQYTRFMTPVYTDEMVRVELEVIELMEKGRVRIQTNLRKEDETLAVIGHAIVIVKRKESQ